MQITEIKAGISVNVFTGESWLKVDALCIKDLGETDDEAFDKLTSKVDELEAKWKAKRLAGQQVLPVIQKDGNPQSLAQQISTCTELKVLESYKLLARSNPEANETYRLKLIELSNK